MLQEVQFKKPEDTLKDKLKQNITGGYWERMDVHILRPFSDTDSVNEYLILDIKYFTKWPKVLPTSMLRG